MTSVMPVLGSATVPAPTGRPALVRCPSCGGPVAGLLADCARRECAIQTIPDEAAFVRRLDI